MNFDWPVENATFYLEAVKEAFAQRKTFLNCDGTQYYLMFNIVLFLKCLVSGYGMVKIVPSCGTYVFLFLQISVHFFLSESWLSLAGEMLYSTAHTGALLWLHEAEEFIPSLPNVMIWYCYSLYSHAEFFLDCYVIVTYLTYIWKAYTSRPHRLSSVICVLFALNWLTDQFVSGESSSVSENLTLYYMPVILLKSFVTATEFNVIPDFYVAVWLIYKLSKTNFAETPVASCKESLEMHLEHMNFSSCLDEICERKSFLNVDENEHYVVFNLLLALKSFVAAYAVTNIVGIFGTLKMMFMNCILTLCNRDMAIALAGFLRFVFIGGYQYVIYVQEYHTAMSSGIWYWVCLDPYFHFFLDIFLIISALIFIEKAYKGDFDKISTLMCFLYITEWLSDKLDGEPLGRIMTIATLYLPVILISACRTQSNSFRILSIVALISLWISFKFEREYFEYGVNKYIYNFYGTSEAFIEYINDLLLRYKITRGVMMGKVM